MSKRPFLSPWVDDLQSRGQYTFTREHVEAQTGRSSVAAQSALRRLKAQGRIVSPRRGFYVTVPPEYRAAGSPPASWFVDDLMGHLSQPYYVGLLSASAIHGSAHQQPMVFQVVTNKPTRAMRAGAIAIEFAMSGIVEQMPVIDQQTETGTMRVATAETTAFDLVRYPVAAGHWANVATVLAELSERIDPRALATIAPLVRLPDVQRLGYALEAIGATGVAGPLARWLRSQRPRAVPLQPDGTAHATLDRKWRVLANVALETEV